MTYSVTISAPNQLKFIKYNYVNIFYTHNFYNITNLYSSGSTLTLHSLLHIFLIYMHFIIGGPVSVVGIATELRAGRSGDRIPVKARVSSPVQTGPGAHPTSCTTGTGSFPGVKSGRGVKLTPHPLLVPWSRKSRAIPLLPLWAVRPVQSLSACRRVHFTFPFFFYIISVLFPTICHWFRNFICYCSNNIFFLNKLHRNLNIDPIKVTELHSLFNIHQLTHMHKTFSR